MSLYELLDLTASNSAKIDVLWNFFIWIHLAVLGGLLLVPRRVSLVERLVVLLAYGAFAYVNRSALIDTYAYQDVLLGEITRFKVAADAVGSGVHDYLANFHLRERIIWLDYAHPIAAAIVAMAILSANRFLPQRRPVTTEAARA
jgi:hypothetical protein